LLIRLITGIVSRARIAPFLTLIPRYVKTKSNPSGGANGMPIYCITLQNLNCSNVEEVKLNA